MTESRVDKHRAGVDSAARQVALNLLWLAPAVLLVVAYLTRVFHGLYLGEAMDAAQIGRHVRQGHGFFTSFIRPVSIGIGPQDTGQPDVTNAPLFPLLLGLVFGVLPASDMTVASVSAAFHVLTVILIFATGRRLVDWRTGALAALLYATSASILTAAAAGTGLSLAAMLSCLSAFILSSEKPGQTRALLAGLVAGLCCLAHYGGLLVAIMIAIMAWHRTGKARALAFAAAGFVAVTAPWWIRNFIVTGDPFFSLQRYLVAMFTTTHPGYTLFRTTDVSQLNLLRFITDDPTELPKKLLLGANNLWQQVPAFLGLALTALFIVGLLRPLTDGAPAAERYRRSAYYLFLLLGLLAAATTMGPEDLALAAPWAAVIAAAALFRFVAPRATAAAVAVLVVIQAFPLAVNLARPVDLSNPSREGLRQIARRFPPDATVVSDIPWAVAWVSDRPSVWLPLTEGDLVEIEKRRNVQAIFLSALVQTYPASERAEYWQEIYVTGSPPKGFQVSDVFQPADILFTREPVRK
jgi:hypothetical protein